MKIVKTLHCEEGGDVEQVATSKQIFCVCDCYSLLVFPIYFCLLIIVHIYSLDTYCFILLAIVLSVVFIQSRRKFSTSILI